MKNKLKEKSARLNVISTASILFSGILLMVAVIVRLCVESSFVDGFSVGFISIGLISWIFATATLIWSMVLKHKEKQIKDECDDN